MPTPRHLGSAGKPSSKTGMALFCVMLMMLTMLAMAVALAKISSLETRLTHSQRDRQIAENAARAAAKIALAELQFFAGTDNVATAQCSIGTPAGTQEWLAAWGSKNPPHAGGDSPLPRFIPLVSRGGNFTGTKIFRSKNSNFTADKIALPWENIGENLRIAYYIIDESQKASLTQSESETYLKTHYGNALQDLRQLSKPNPGFRAVFESTNTNSEEFRSRLKTARYDEGFFLENFPQKNDISKSFTKEALGVLADWPRNKLKSDLSSEKFSDDIFTEKFLRGGNAHFLTSAGSGILSATVPAESHGTMRLKDEVFPLIVDLRLHIGFFNTRSDGQHRAKFHITTKLWNPHSFPLLAHGDGNFGFLDFDNLPPAEIHNSNTNATFTFGLSDFPTGRFGLVSQTASDKTFNAYCKIFDSSDQGFGGTPKAPFAGLHPGEIFLAVYPNPDGQPSGLSRITGGATWKFQKKATDKPPSGTQGDRWFHASHKIKISAAPSILPSSFLFRFYAGNISSSMPPKNYSAPFFGFKNLSFPGFVLEISGEKYNREKSGDYSINEANVVYQIRLKTENQDTLKRFLDTSDFRSGVLDFAKKEVAEAFEISIHTGADAETLAKSKSYPGETYFFDKYENLHKAEEPSAFACVPFFDKPTLECLSTGTLRYFQAGNLPHHAVGGKYNSTTDSPNKILDEYFFSGNVRSAGTLETNPHLFTLRERKALQNPSPATTQISAEKFLLRGAFNINSTDAGAWLAVLSNDFSEWKQRFSGNAEDKKTAPAQDLKNVFFIRPFSAQIISPGTNTRGLSDAELEKYDKRSRERILLAQGFRAVKDDKIKALAESIAERIKQRLTTGKQAFHSIAEFADSGILENAIEDAKINTLGNEKIPAWFPGFLTQSDIVQTLVLTATPRGDTFKIIARAEKLNSLTGNAEAVAVAEIRVQRIPEFFDASQPAGTLPEKQNALNRVLGRRFKIVGMRLLNHDEMQ